MKKVADRLVETGGEVALGAGRAVANDDPEAVRLVARCHLPLEGEEAAVGRVARRAVEPLVQSCQVLRGRERRGVAVNRHGEDVHVRRERGVRIAVRGESELGPVGRQVEVLATSDGEDGRVEVARRQVADGLRGVGLGEVEDENMRALALLPFGPVAVEEGVREVGLDLVRFAGAGGLLVARGVGAAVRVHVRREDDEAAVLRERGRVDAAREGRLLFGIAARERQEEELRLARARRDEGERLPVRREGGVIVVSVTV